MSEGSSPEQQGADTRGASHQPGAPNAGEASASPQQGGEAASSRACEQCGAPLKPDQNWCLQCGTGAGSASAGPGWRTAAAAIGASAVLALGAAAAAFAAFKEGSPSPASPVSTVAQTPASPTPASPTTTVTTTTATATSTTGSALPATASKPPKIPADEATPANGGTAGKTTGQDKTTPAGSGSKDEGGKTKTGKGQSGAGTKDEEEDCKTVTGTEAEEDTESSSSTSTSTTTTATTTTTQTSSTDGEPSEKEECAAEKNTRGAKAAPISLKAEDASTYNPNGYAASGFTSPALAIDGIATTAWTAAPAFGLAPKVQAGLLLDLEGERRIAKVGLISKTLGMTVQIYGTTQRKPPKSITAAGWQKLSGVHLVEERSSTISLRRLPKIRQLLVWVLRAPEVEPEVQGETVEESAAIDEIALYEPK